MGAFGDKRVETLDETANDGEERGRVTIRVVTFERENLREVGNADNGICSVSSKGADGYGNYSVLKRFQSLFE